MAGVSREDKGRGKRASCKAIGRHACTDGEERKVKKIPKGVKRVAGDASQSTEEQRRVNYYYY